MTRPPERPRTPTAHAIEHHSLRGTTKAVRWLFVGAAVLAGVAGFEAFVLSEDTDRFFAWTIDSPLTAAFLGACYWSAIPLMVLCYRERLWARARLGYPAVFALVVLLELVTLRHIDRFHMDAVTGWQWLAVYTLLPPAMVLILLGQLKVPGGDPPRRLLLPLWVRAVLWGQAGVMLVVGTGLLLFPGSVRAAWPWALTTLTARAVGVWLIAVGVATAHSGVENDWTRLHAPFVAYVVLAALQYVALARYGDEVAWDEPEAWLYVAFLGSVLALGLYGWQKARAAGADPASERVP